MLNENYNIMLQKLNQFYGQATQKTFEEIWGDAIGQHVWRQFVNNNHQLPIWKFGGNDIEKIESFILNNSNYER